ncbi:hypothetical protein D2E53_21495 [Mycobacteroides abscessus]|nr:hypothetical protein D2E35_17545 [Mycobacteroides abscessus]RIR34542.1 hypothetical protein D2E38_14950 [Mycobacteroides abscessus]RIR43123.1 hypothetical protein D2E36_06180 [Mycobacteroides abscessus]RIR50642.1 hypothetical protein D2E37_21240 [Mycobacteroides abscessus]RIS47164.1 hypothetical protein D2E71_11500 [Mycobacteroides abscessus]
MEMPQHGRCAQGDNRPDRIDTTGSRARPQAREAESFAGMAMPAESITYPRRRVRGGALAGIVQRGQTSLVTPVTWVATARQC